MDQARSIWSTRARMPLSVTNLALIAASLALALALRHLVVEPPAIGHACDIAPWEGWCAARSLLLQSFAHQELGWIAALCGALALVTRRRALARLAVVFGCLGLVLYSYDLSAFGLIAGLFALCRAPSQSRP